MRPLLLSVLVAALALPAAATDNFSPPKASPAQMAVTSEVVVVGKVTSVSKDLINAASPFPGDNEKVKYKVAVVTVQTRLVGVEGLKEIKVGVPDEKDGKAVELKEGQQLLLFLTKHPRADLYLLPFYIDTIREPIDVTTADGKKALADARRGLAIAADPLKALKSDKTRVEAAVLLALKYYRSPEYGGETDTLPVDAEESKLILKGLAEGEWKKIGDNKTTVKLDNPFHAFEQLPLNDHAPFPDVLRTVPPGADYAAYAKAEFVKWLAGPGKDFRITKVVPKKEGKK
jgi:hypothetical protein